MSTNWITRRRKELGLSQELLTNRLQLEGIEVSRAALSHWENARYNPPLEDKIFRQALAKSLELDVKELLLLAGYEIAEGENEMAVRAAIIVSHLPPDIQKHALDYLQMLEKQHA